jgi:hypothetical protein
MRLTGFTTFAFMSTGFKDSVVYGSILRTMGNGLRELGLQTEGELV